MLSVPVPFRCLGIVTSSLDGFSLVSAAFCCLRLADFFDGSLFLGAVSESFLQFAADSSF